MSKYNYYNLKELNNKKDINFYGVIVDATFPCKEDNDDNVYVSTLKVIDNSVNMVNNPIDFLNDIIYVTVKSDLIEYLPFVQHIGDIIRIHRGQYVSFINKKIKLLLLIETIFLIFKY